MMRRLGRDSMLAAALAGIVVVLGAVVAWQVGANGMRSVDDSAPLSDADNLPELPDVLSLPELAFDSYSEIVERPVFSPSRRPANGPVRAILPTPGPGRSFVLELVGLVSVGDRRVAMVRQRGSREVVQLGKGDTFGNWTVGEIGADFILVQSSDGEQEIRLSYRPR